MIKFTVEQCRLLLEPEDNARLSDAEVEQLRDEMYATALVAVTSAMSVNDRNPGGEEERI